MIKPKGVDVLMSAFERLQEHGDPLRLELYGPTDPVNPDAIAADLLQDWCKTHHAHWPGETADVREVWRRADIFVLPARSREGMPRAMLEAAACARPLIVTDVPGCRHFVRNGIEGLVVPPEDAAALAEALRLLASDRGLRERMGAAARSRLLEGFTEAHVKDILGAVYRQIA
jgi:glycosyltransferase involved in cell wall biosynthesis